MGTWIYNKNKILRGKDVSKFVIGEIKTVSAIQSKCHVCGFENPKEEMNHFCPMCNTNLVIKTANISEGEPFCASFTFR